jgi:uncharacterized protein (TIGR02246 family)
VTTTEIDAAEQAAIADVPARMIAAWAAHDAAAFAGLFTADGTMILPGVYQKGRDEIRRFMDDAYAGQYRGTQVTGTPIEIKWLGPDAVVLVSVGGILAPGVTELPGRAAIRASWVMVKRDGRWCLAVYQNCARDAVG